MSDVEGARSDQVGDKQDVCGVGITTSHLLIAVTVADRYPSANVQELIHECGMAKLGHGT